MRKERGIVLGIFIATGIAVVNAVQFTLLFPGFEAVAVERAQAIDVLPVSQERKALPKVDIPEPPVWLDEISADSIYLSYEWPQPKLLLQKNEYEQSSLASLTKLVTALVLLDMQPKWNEEVVVARSDFRGGAKSRLWTGSTVTQQDLWKAMLIGSDNDSTAALVRAVAGNEQAFVSAMNQKVSGMGLTQTEFTDPTGLSDGNVSTTREFAVLARLALREPIIRDTVSMTSDKIVVSGRSVTLHSTDQRLRYHDVDDHDWGYEAGKTGYTRAAGYSVALMTNDKDGSDLLLVLLGSDSTDKRNRDAERLLKWGIAETK